MSDSDANAKNRRRATAFHEAGHAVAAWHFGRELGLFLIENEVGTAEHSPDLAAADNPASCETQAVIFRAGLVAERTYCGGGPLAKEGSRRDLAEIQVLAAIVDGTCYKAFYRRVARVTRMLIQSRTHHIEAVASALLERGKISGSEARALLDRIG